MSGGAYRSKVLVAMSGGVDSSVAAALLLRAGYEVVGCFMRLGSEDSADAAEGEDASACGTGSGKPGHQGCCSLNDASDARMVAALLGVPFYVLNFKRDFGRVIDYFVGQYNQGRTPNPCIRCNDWLKFGKLLDYARSIDAAYIATGHYARVDRTGGRARLRQGIDEHKDQSYVLMGTPRERLERMLLPIGDYRKPAIRELAREMGLPVFDKPDSQEICFVPDNDYARLVARRTPDAVTAGSILDEHGERIGEHPGHQHYTIGQRRGLGVARGYPLYVIQKDPHANTVTLGPREQLMASGLVAHEPNWLIEPPAAPLRCTARIRHNQRPVAATVRVESPDAFRVVFDVPQAAVTPGQAVACYVGDELVAGGWIHEAAPVPAAS